MLSALNVVYQPIYEFPSGKIFGYEALLRTSQPNDLFFKNAAASNQIVEVDRAIHRLALSHAHISPGRKLFLNCHPKSIENIEVFRREEHVQIKGEVVVEITEQAASVDWERIHVLKRLKNVKIALDDFGVGANNIHMLDQARPDILKIDRLVIQGLDKKLIQDYVELIVRWGQETGTPIIAEGIETRDQLEQCLNLGIRIFQGFLLGIPKRFSKGHNLQF